jgi:hypothetical protein
MDYRLTACRIEHFTFRDCRLFLGCALRLRRLALRRRRNQTYQTQNDEDTHRRFFPSVILLQSGAGKSSIA